MVVTPFAFRRTQGPMRSRSGSPTVVVSSTAASAATSGSWFAPMSSHATKPCSLADGVDVSPVLSRDGRRIAYQHDGSSIHVVDVDGTNDRSWPVATSAGRPFAGSREIAWSPDNAWLAFLSTEDKGFTNAYVVPSAGGERRAVSFLANAFAGSVLWSSDGQFLLYDTSQRTEQSSLVRIDLVPRTPRFREDQFRDLFSPPPARDTGARVSTPRDSDRARHRAHARRRSAQDRDRAGMVCGSARVSCSPASQLGDLSPDGKTVMLVGAVRRTGRVCTRTRSIRSPAEPAGAAPAHDQHRRQDRACSIRPTARMSGSSSRVGSRR